MTSAVRALGSRWFLSFIGIALIAQQVWFYGPLLEPLESTLVRAAILVGLFNVWLVGNLVIDLTRRKRDTVLAAGITQRGPGDDAAEEAAGVQDRLTAGLAILRKTRGKRGYLYEQPWYAIIGPPGAGKTTALLNCGLSFPLAGEMGQGAVAGVGGTRQCDWWFTDKAVLIDTAGRYTTQDSDAQVDRAGWDAFLDLLKRTRSRQPLNGVLVALALNDIARATDAERAAHARAIRQRVQELETRLGVRMPVYLLFTKADLLAGFSEFFGDLDRDGRAQVWGATFPLGAGQANPGAAFEAEFQLLLERLNAQLIDRLHVEADLNRRALIAGFPAQVASLGPPIVAFIQDTFSASKQERAPFLRGVYLTSATQEGTPIDRLTGRLARSFGVDQRRLAPLRPEAGRSFFLAELLQGVIFNEAMLVSQRPGRARRILLLRASAYTVVVLLAVAAAAVLWIARNNAAESLARTAQALSAYEQAAHDMPLDPVSDADLPVLLPLLDEARNLPHGQAPTTVLGTGLELGLSQNAKLDAATREVYRHALGYALLPRLIWRLEAEMRGRMNQPDFVYEATRVYLMLGNAGPLDRGLVHDWMMLDWDASYPGTATAPMRALLLQHLDALLTQPLPQVQLDGALVAQARSTFAQVSLAQRVYSLIRPSAAAQAIPSWKPRDALGPAGATIFVRASGKSLDDGIPGFFTVDGFYRVLMPAVGNAAKTIASESWVLGERAQVDPNSPQMQAIEQQVIQLYETDYIRLWDAMLADLNIRPLTSVVEAAQDLYILASPESPMRKLLASIGRQVTLTAAPGGAAGPATGASAAPAPAPDQRLAGLFGAAPTGTEAAPQAPGHEVDEHFKALRDLVGNGPGAPIDLVLKSMVDLQQQLAKMAAAAPGSPGAQAPSGGVDPTLALRVEGKRQPPPLSRWLASLATSGAALRGSDPRAQIATLYNGDGGPAELCAASVTGHYPFDANSTNDTPLAAFTKLFAPSGVLDGFVVAQLHPYLVTTAKPWTLQQVNNVSAPITTADLAQFQRAAAIRDTFFPSGASTPTIRFDITPVSVDPATKQATLDLGGTTVVASRAPPHTTQIVWPGATHMDSVKLTFDPPPASGSATIQASGPWAMFRVLNQGHPKDTGSGDRYTLTFQVGDRKAVFELRAASAVNAFVPGVLSSFRCPAVQQ